MSLMAAASLIATPLAEAASYTYANNVLTAENQIRSSGLRSLIGGGSAVLQPYSADGGGTDLYLESYRPAPGYQIIMTAKGGSSVSMSHAASTNAHQKCRWDWPWWSGDIGTLRLTCMTK